MPEYDSRNYNPPAPVAYVTLRNSATGAVISNVPMLMDTGADASLLPSQAIEELKIETEKDSTFEVQGFDGQIQRLKSVKLEMYFLDKKFVGEYLLVDQPIGILGRNVLNNVRILLDGPRENWDEQKT